jgi:hypothetical protein
MEGWRQLRIVSSGPEYLRMRQKSARRQPGHNGDSSLTLPSRLNASLDLQRETAPGGMTDPKKSRTGSKGSDPTRYGQTGTGETREKLTIGDTRSNQVAGRRWR